MPMRALTLTFAGALLLSTSALANQSWLQRADIDGDGVITQAEAQRYEQLKLAAIDTNRDHIVTASEWNAAPDFTFEYADLNSDGVLLPEELHSAYLSGYRYNGMVAEPVYGGTATYPLGTVHTYTYVSPQQPLTTERVVVRTAPYTGPVYAAPTYVEPPAAMVPQQGYILQGRTQQPIYAPQVGTTAPQYGTQYSYAPQPGYTVTATSELAHGDLAPGNPLSLDVNRDGMLTIAEVLRYNDGTFQRADKDRNGWIDAYEWDLKAQEHFGHRVNPAALGTLSHDTFGRHDRDGDGRVSKVEWDRQVEAEFTILDDNNDGLLHLSDFQIASR